MDQGSEIRDKRKITLKLLKTWQEDIQKDKYCLILLNHFIPPLIKLVALVCIYVLYASVYNFPDHLKRLNVL